MMIYEGSSLLVGHHLTTFEPSTPQVHCYEDNRFLKIFSDILRLMYDAEIVGEDTIQHWCVLGGGTRGSSGWVYLGVDARIDIIPQCDRLLLVAYLRCLNGTVTSDSEIYIALPGTRKEATPRGAMFS